MTLMQPKDSERLARLLYGRQGEVADGVQTSRQRINSLTSGRAPRVRIQLAAAIEDYLNVPRGDLFTLNPDDLELIAEYVHALRSSS